MFEASEVDDDDLGPRPFGLGYMDDLFISVPWQLAIPVYGRVKQIFQKYGLELNEDKCRFVGINGLNIAERCEGRGEAIPLRFEFRGDIILGNPVGTAEYRREMCLEICKEKTASLKTLTDIQLSSCSVFNLIKLCYNPSASFLARIQEPREFGEGLRYFDAEIDQAIARTAGHDIEERSKRERLATIRSLPTEWGGLGVGRHSWISGDIACRKSRFMVGTTRLVDLEYHMDGVEGVDPSSVGLWSQEHTIGFNPHPPYENIMKVDEVVVHMAYPALKVDSEEWLLLEPAVEKKVAETVYEAVAEALFRYLSINESEGNAAWFCRSWFPQSHRALTPRYEGIATIGII
jgi:hypothetical protein